jgi:hypothetical protein
MCRAAAKIEARHDAPPHAVGAGISSPSESFFGPLNRRRRRQTTTADIRAHRERVDAANEVTASKRKNPPSLPLFLSQ